MPASKVVDGGWRLTLASDNVGADAALYEPMKGLADSVFTEHQVERGRGCSDHRNERQVASTLSSDLSSSVANYTIDMISWCPSTTLCEGGCSRERS